MTQHEPGRARDATSARRPPSEAGAAGSVRTRWAMAAVLSVVLVVAAVLVVLEVAVLRPRADAGEADRQARSQAVRAAERFTVQVNTYRAGSIDDYRTSMNAMMSPKFRADYKRVLDQLQSTIQQAKVTSRGEVLASAVASLDSDSASVLVVSDASVSTIYDKRVARHFRWEVSLVRIEGRWLVDDFSPVG